MADPTAIVPATAPADTAPRISVVDPNGQLVTIPSSQLDAATKQGYAVASQARIAAAQPKSLGDQLYNIGETSEAGLRGLLRGGTAGLSDVAETRAAGAIGNVLGQPGWQRDEEEQIARLKEEHPIASGLGEAGGLIGGTLLGGTEAGLATKALNPMRAIESAGTLAEGIASRAGSALGLSSANVLGRAGQAAIRLGARGAAETAIYTGTNELSEEMLGEPGLNAEKILAAGLEGAKGGALFGMALGAGGSLISSAVGGLKGLAANPLTKNPDLLGDAANEQRWRALNPSLKYAKEANARFSGGTAGIGEVLGRYGITGSTIEEAMKGGDIGAISAKVDDAIGRVGQELGASYESSAAQIPLSKVREVIDNAIAPMRGKAGLEPAVNSLERYRDSLMGHLAPGGYSESVGMNVQRAVTEDTAKALGATMRFPEDVAKTSEHIFGGHAPDAAGWQSIWRPPEGYTSKIQSFSAADGALSVDVHILNSEGTKVGELENTFARKNGKLVVKHEFIQLDPSVQGKGIATALHQSQMDAYQTLGVSRVDLHAAMSAGRYANARLGFSWPKEEGAAWQQKLADFLAKEAPGSQVMAIFPRNAPEVAKLEIGGRKLGKEFLQSGENWSGSIDVGAKAKATVPIQSAIEQRKALDQLVFHETKSLDPNMRVAAMRDIRRNFEGVIVDAFDDAAKAAGSDGAKAKLLALKRDYQGLSIAQNAAEDSVSRSARNRNISLSDYMAGGILSNIGGAIAGPIGHVAGGAAGAAINKFGRERGNAIAAAVLDKASAYARAQKAIAKTDDALERAARGIVMGPKESAGASRALGGETKSLKERYLAAVKRVNSMQSNPMQLLEGAQVHNEHLPQTSQAMTMATVRSASYLDNAMGPKSAGMPTLGQPLVKPLSNADMAAALERYNVATNPFSALRDFDRGRLSVNQARAFQQTSPELFKELQMKAFDVVQKRQAAGDPIPFDGRQRMHILLGIMTDPSQDPKMVASLQGNLASGDGQPGQGPQAKSPSSPKRPVKLPDQTSKLDRLEER